MSQRIAARLGEEFAAQAEKERALGLPVTVLVAPTLAARAKAEQGFIGAHTACTHTPNHPWAKLVRL